MDKTNKQIADETGWAKVTGDFRQAAEKWAEVGATFDAVIEVRPAAFHARVDLLVIVRIEREDADAFWACGVHPGAITASGPTPTDALAAMRLSLGLVFHDFADEALDFDAFKAEVERFYFETGKRGERDPRAWVRVTRM